VPWYATAIAIWSAFIASSSVGWGRISVGGVEEYSHFQIIWGVLVPALVAMAAAVAIIVLSLRGTYRRVRGLFVVTAILGVVGILGAVISVAALVHTRRARPTR
jgi:hypothetical protein